MRKTVYVLVSLLVLCLCWEKGMEASPVIPEESIRLRILANSDAPQDQWIKRKVRDAVVEEINGWVSAGNLRDLESARALVLKDLPRLEAVVEQTLERHGFSYGADLQLGKADFPTKVYGFRLYPAGKYEALVIALGEGKGKNWWCVLFPPLCFIDVTTGEYEDENKPRELSTGQELSTGKLPAEKDHSGDKPEIRIAFFFLELWNWLFG